MRHFQFLMIRRRLGCLAALSHGLSPALAPLLRPRSVEKMALELPFRLILSPPRTAGFIHPDTPMLSSFDPAELWHSQLGVAPGRLGDVAATDKSPTHPYRSRGLILFASRALRMLRPV
jgi:hypothetical protein